MKASTSKKPVAPPPRSGRGFIAAVVALVAVVAGLALFFWARGKGPTAHRSRGHAATVKGSYRNRSLVVAPEAAGAPEPEQPVIRGNVYDSLGGRIAGAKIVVLTYDVAGNMASAVSTVQADDDGRFEIPLTAGTYQLNVSQEGYGPTSVVAQTGDTVSAVLPRSGTIKGHVVDAKGKPVRKFTVDLVSAVPGDAPAPPPVWSKTFDSKDGSFEANQFPAWPVVVRASSVDYAPGFSKPMQIRPDETREVTLTLSDGCVLEGTVVDKDGHPLPKVLVNAEERLTAGTIADPVIQASTQDVSDTKGNFRLEHVPRGTVMVRGYDGDNAASTLTVEVADCDKLQPVKLVMSPGGSVEGTTRTADGKPLPGARVTITERAVGIVNTMSDNEGHYRFDELPAGIFRIQVDYESQSALKFVQIREGATSHLDLPLFAAGTGGLKGKVTAGDKPLAGARLLVAANHGRTAGVGMYFPVTDKDGAFRVPALPEGAYLISVMSTPAGTGVQIKKDETAEVSIDVSPMLGVGQPAANANVPPVREHPRRLRQMRQQQGAGEGDSADSAGEAQ
jgi:protocatechuate 3,4-dioxygenase beta subunit